MTALPDPWTHLRDVPPDRLIGHLDAIGVDPRSTGDTGQTLLSLAARQGLHHHLRALLADGRHDVAQGDRMGMTPLLWAINGDHLDCVMPLLGHPGSLAPADDGCTPLMLAAANGQPAMVRALLPVSDPGATHNKGWTALMHAARNNRADNLEVLLPHSDAGRTSRHGLNAWLLAGQQGAAQALEVLRPHVDPHQRDPLGNTALMLMVGNRHLTERVTLAALPVCLALCDATATNRAGHTALSIVVEQARWALVPPLLKAMPRAQAVQVQQALLNNGKTEGRSAARALERWIRKDLQQEQHDLRAAMEPSIASGPLSDSPPRAPRRPRL